MAMMRSVVLYWRDLNECSYYTCNLLPVVKVIFASYTKEVQKRKPNEPAHDKTYKMACAPSELRSAWASAQFDQFRATHEESLGP